MSAPDNPVFEGDAAPPDRRRKIAIVGAGIGGMAAAYDLARAGHQVVIFEADDHAGGLAAGFRDEGWDWSVERFYHHWFASDRHILGLIDELGWSGRVRFPRPYTVVYHEGKFYPFDSIPQALLFPGLGWGLNKIRFGLVGLYLRLTNNWKALEQYTAEAWMRRWAGAQVYEKMWQPLLEGKFGPHYKQVNMAWMWARIKARTTRLGTFEGGFQAFADELADYLRGQGVEIRLKTLVRRISKNPGPGLTLDAETGSSSWDQVLVTTSPSLLARIAPGLPASYLQGLLNLTSMGAVVMIMALRHQLSEQGYYWYNIPKSAGFPFLALVEHTNYLSPEYFGGDHIVYCGDYLEPDHEYFDLTADELFERFLPALPRFNPHFERGWVRKTWLFRTRYAQPVPFVNHSRNIPDIQTPMEGLYFASMSQVYPWDRGTNFAVEIGRRAARIMQGLRADR
jgi:protoporphyrinogen oxidase